MPFKKGQSGNPKGRRPGIKDRRVRYRELLDSHAPKLIAKARGLALAGDTVALKMCLDRILPPIRVMDEPISLGKIGGSLSERGEYVVNAMLQGQLSSSEASDMLSVLAAQARIREVDELERRVAALEVDL